MNFPLLASDIPLKISNLPDLSLSRAPAPASA